jgi:hypothetical protein
VKLITQQLSTITAGIHPNLKPTYKKVNKLHTGETTINEAKLKVRSTANKSEEIMAINFPELVFARLSTLRAVTLSNITAHNVLLILIEVIYPY